MSSAVAELSETLRLRAVQIEVKRRHGIRLSYDESETAKTPEMLAAIEAYRASVAARPRAEPPVVRSWVYTERLEDAFVGLVPGMRRLDSPAETALLLGFLTPAKGRRVTLSPPDAILLTDAQGRSLRLALQVSKGGRVLDFALNGGNEKTIAVEVDGHTFHGSEEQVTADKARDRELMAIDVETIRFTAKEVFADPLRCAGEAFRIGLMKCAPFVVRPMARDGAKR